MNNHPLPEAPKMRKPSPAQQRRAESFRCTPAGCLYLNNSGHRWVQRDMTVRIIGTDYDKYRKADSIEAAGNFAVYVVRYKGEIRRAEPTDYDQNGHPVIYFKD